MLHMLFFQLYGKFTFRYSFLCKNATLQTKNGAESKHYIMVVQKHIMNRSWELFGVNETEFGVNVKCTPTADRPIALIKASPLPIVGNLMMC